MTTRISASYPATDGSAPENIEITWDEEHRQPTADELLTIIGALAHVPRRYDVTRIDKPRLAFRLDRTPGRPDSTEDE